MARSSVDEALQRIEDTAEAQLDSLATRFQEIDAHVHPSSGRWAPHDAEACCWTALRLKTLRRRDRIATAVALGNGFFSKNIYAALWDADLHAVAEDFARGGNLAALGVLLQYHPYVLAPVILEKLNAVPETTPPQHLGPILQQILHLREAPTLQRPEDWAEGENVAYEMLRYEPEWAAGCMTEAMASRVSGWNPPNSAHLAKWIRRRAILVDEHTGQLQLAMELLEVGRERLQFGEASHSLGELRGTTRQLMTIIKLAAKVDTLDSTWRLGLGAFAAMDDAAKIHTLFSLVESDALADAIPDTVVPFLNQLELTPGSAALAQIMTKILEKEAAQRPSWVVRFLQAEARRQWIFASASHLVKAACASAYACLSTEAWSLQESLLKTAADALQSDVSLDPAQIAALLQALDAVGGHLTAARILTKNGLPTTISHVRDATKNDALVLMRMLLARAARARRPAGDRGWGALWADLESARSSGLRIISEEELRVEVCRSLLSCGQLKIARRHLAALRPERREALVLEAARDAFYAEESAGVDAIRAAQDILDTIPESKAAREEAAFIVAAGQLRSLGVDLPPLALRQTTDKAGVLRQAVRGAPIEALRDVDTFLQLSRALGTGLGVADVLTLVADAAMASGNVALAEDLAVRMARQGAREGWKLAAHISLEETCSNEAVRRMLLQYAMRFAASETLPTLLQCWQASDAGAWGDAAVWILAEEESVSQSFDANKMFISPAQAAIHGWLQAAISVGENKRKHVALVDGASLLGCLLALGPDSMRLWARTLQANRSELGHQFLRWAYSAGIAAAAITTLAGRGEDAPATCGDLLGETAEDLMLASLAEGSTTSESNEDLAEKRSLQSLILEMAKALVSSADAVRVAAMLPHHTHARKWLEVDAASQRDLILHLASEAGSSGLRIQTEVPESPTAVTGAEESVRPEPDLATRVVEWSGWDEESEEQEIEHSQELGDGVSPPVGRKKSEAQMDSRSAQKNLLSQGPVSLDNALELAQRCGVPEWEVQRAYVVAVVLRLVLDGTDGAGVQADVNSVWPQLLATHPKETLNAMFTDVLPKCFELESLEASVMALRLCQEAVGRLQGEVDSSKLAVPMASEVFTVLATAAGELHTCVPEMPFPPYLKPFLSLLSLTYGIKASRNESQVDGVRLLPAFLFEHMATDTVDVARRIFPILDHLARTYSALGGAIQGMQGHVEVGPYPVSASGVYVAALCRELASMMMSEGIEMDQKGRIMECFATLPLPDAVSMAAFACLGGPLPLDFGESFTSVLLGPEQCLAVLEASLPSIDASLASVPPELLPEDMALTAKKLHAEATRLAVVHLVESQCDRLVYAAQISKISQLAQQLHHASFENPGGEPSARDILNGRLSALLTSGFPIGEVFVVASVCTPLITDTEEESRAYTAVLNSVKGATNAAILAVSDAAEAAVDEVLRTFLSYTGTTASSEELPSIGDAIQNLYGVLRALDDTGPKIHAGFPLKQLEQLRLRVWTRLHRHLTEHQPEGNAAAAEAHLQVFEMLGALGRSLWTDWERPRVDATDGKAFDPTEALLYSKVAAILAPNWPAALALASLSAKDFASVTQTEAALLRLVDQAQCPEHLDAVLYALDDVLDPAFSDREESNEAGTSDVESTVNNGQVRKIRALHHVWSACIRSLMLQGALETALSGLDRGMGLRNDPGRESTAGALVTPEEARELVGVAETAFGPCAAAAVALLLPYNHLRLPAWEKFVRSNVWKDAHTPLGMAVLAVVALYRGYLSDDLTTNNPALFRMLCVALLHLETPASVLYTGGVLATDKATSSTVIPVRTALAAAAAAALVNNGHSTPAAWIALEHAGMHPLFRILDSANIALRHLLQAGAHARGLILSELEPAAAREVVVARTVEAVLRSVPSAAAHALQRDALI